MAKVVLAPPTEKDAIVTEKSCLRISRVSAHRADR
jgi:hypothetical protein